MGRRRKVELVERIRRDNAAGETIKQLTKKYGVHRRMVRQVIAGAIPPETEEARTKAAEDRCSKRGNRPDPGNRSPGAA
jgi:hypothetical protein